MGTAVGVYHIDLLETADEGAFAVHMAEKVFKSVKILQLTRTTSGFNHKLLKRTGGARQFAWLVTVHLVSGPGYDFEQNVERLQASLENFGVVKGVDTYTEIGMADDE
jgi:hypothetical protein